MAVAALVVMMVIVGGITRLTESGLSITEWKPVTGILPPLSEAQWQAEFAAYRQIPEYLQINGPAGMTMADYKFIYFWEWVHRLLGRVIGIAFALPLAWYWIKGFIPAGYKPRLLALLALGALQGVFGWLMVRSGIDAQAVAEARTSVSHYWLSIHLMTALFTLGGLVWTALDLRGHADGIARARLLPFGLAVFIILALQMLFGAWMAGLDAGYVARDWPLMQGAFVPAGIDWSQGVWHAVTADPFLIHFIHRWWAWVAVGVLIVLARKDRNRGSRPASIAIHAAFGTQILLGIATVMTGVALWIAVAHQGVGALLVMATAWGVHVLGTQQQQRQRAHTGKPLAKAQAQAN
ncbi:COX15/CtaA family protein [Croceicoccus sp. F390]|uniref:Heme A synthase n=2 Tax=Croceicoccus esteveae TaxID=3075597 RepID=A0ABU2ZHM8_9SPHN|nr:COX15/CtaA family protein [Croceicoccus sp. F390]MDT0576113.1 COX15/CtaA family protein [Croceicoccus sp. F390]